MALMDGELLYPAPLNAVRAPHGSKRGYSGRSRPILARLVWPKGTVIVAARLAWVDLDVVCIEWERRGVSRRSWIPRKDTALWMTLP